MEMTQKVVERAIETGLKLLEADDVFTPNAWNKDLASLEQVLLGVLAGQLELRTVKQPEAPPGKLGGGDLEVPPAGAEH